MNTKTFLAFTEEFKETGKTFSGDREAEIECWVVFFVGGGFVLYCFRFFTSYVSRPFSTKQLHTYLLGFAAI